MTKKRSRTDSEGNISEAVMEAGSNTKQESDSQRQGLMNMFSESNLVNFQRVYKRVDDDNSSKKAGGSNVADTEGDDSSGEEDEAVEGDEPEPLASTVVDETKNDRTLFVGNLPISMSSQKAILKYFSKYGKIESIRIRSVPISGIKIDRAGDQNLVKKVCANQHKYGDQKSSVNAYIVYEDVTKIEEIINAENNKLIENRHIRVDKVNPSLFDQQKSIFIGGLPYRIDEEEVREFFAKVSNSHHFSHSLLILFCFVLSPVFFLKALPNGQDDIDGIRIVRDPETLLGKGIGYMLFKERDHVLAALRLHEVMI
jgi:nucleolar protein 12